MVTAIVMLECEVDMIPETAEAVAEIDGVAEVYSIAGGDCDLIAVVRVKEHEELAEIVTGHILKTDGIIGSNTYVAFKSYSQKDLDRMWEIGLENE